MALKTRKWDVTEYLDSPEEIAGYLEAVMEIGDPALIAAAIGDVARARGMTQIAKDTGLAREALYRALSEDGRPEFATVMKVLKALGLRLSAMPLSETQSAQSHRPRSARRAIAQRARLTTRSSHRRRRD